jgi:hypothetical protein
MGGWFKGSIVALAAMATAAGAQPVHAPGLRAMRDVEAGRWQLRATGTTARPQESCVADTAVFLRLRHRAAQCSRFVIADAPGGATVHYTCPGAGHVRTAIRVDTPRVLRIESEGIADGMPFADRIEARRVGFCRAPGR